VHRTTWRSSLWLSYVVLGVVLGTLLGVSSRSLVAAAFGVAVAWLLLTLGLAIGRDIGSWSWRLAGPAKWSSERPSLTAIISAALIFGFLGSPDDVAHAAGTFGPGTIVLADGLRLTIGTPLPVWAVCEVLLPPGSTAADPCYAQADLADGAFDVLALYIFETNEDSLPFATGQVAQVSATGITLDNGMTIPLPEPNPTWNGAPDTGCPRLADLAESDWGLSGPVPVQVAVDPESGVATGYTCLHAA
jgi:hypothetical protein